MDDGLDFDLRLLADNVRRFMGERVAPRVPEWEEAGEFPRSHRAEKRPMVHPPDAWIVAFGSGPPFLPEKKKFCWLDDCPGVLVFGNG